MLEPLFRCNLACVGCGKIDYPDAILNRRMSAQECWDAATNVARRCGHSGREPLIHKEIADRARSGGAQEFVSLCTNALLLEKKLDLFEPSPYLFSRASRRLEGPSRQGGLAEGVFDRAVSAIKAAKARASRSTSTPPSSTTRAEDIAKFLDFTTELGVGVSMSPGYAYERAPTRSTSSTAPRPRSCSATCSRWARQEVNFMHSGLFLDSWPAIRATKHPWGMRPATFSAGRSHVTCSARLYQDLQGTDGDHGLGHLRHRQI